MPVDGYLELQAHNDALFQELELISIELEGDHAAEVAAPWPTSWTSCTAGSGASGTATATWSPPPRPPAGHGRLATTAARRRRARSYLALLEQADELCRAGVLLTPEPPASVKALRSWFVDQMAAQVLHGATRHAARLAGRSAAGQQRLDPQQRAHVGASVQGRAGHRGQGRGRGRVVPARRSTAWRYWGLGPRSYRSR